MKYDSEQKLSALISIMSCSGQSQNMNFQMLSKYYLDALMFNAIASYSMSAPLTMTMM